MHKLGKLNSIWGATLVICATIVISSLATATASNLINGKRLKNASVAGTKLKKNTLTGKQVNESKLGTVPSAASAANAGLLGGLPASAFAQGNARLYAGSAAPAISTSDTPVLTISGYGSLAVDCNILGEASFDFKNESGSTLTLVGTSTSIASSNVAAAPYVPSLSAGASTSFGNGGGGITTFQAWASGTSGKNATVTISSQLCSTTASAVTIG